MPAPKNFDERQSAEIDKENARVQKNLNKAKPAQVWRPGEPDPNTRAAAPKIPGDEPGAGDAAKDPKTFVTPPAGTNWHPEELRTIQAASYTFMVSSFSILTLRSRSRDTDFLSETVVVDGQAPVKKDSGKLGDLDTGVFPQGSRWALGPVPIGPADAQKGIVFHYTMMNTGHGDWNKINELIAKWGAEAAQAGAKAVSSAGGALVGAMIGNAAVPLFGAAVGAICGWISAELTSLITANCDGPVIDTNLTFSGQSLWDLTEQGGGVATGVVEQRGWDSASGCGANSHYTSTWQILRS